MGERHGLQPTPTSGLSRASSFLMTLGAMIWVMGTRGGGRPLPSWTTFLMVGTTIGTDITADGDDDATKTGFAGWVVLFFNSVLPADTVESAGMLKCPLVNPFVLFNRATGLLEAEVAKCRRCSGLPAWITVLPPINGAESVTRSDLLIFPCVAKTSLSLSGTGTTA